MILLHLFLLFVYVTGNPLVGEPHRCSHEGAPVQVSSALLGINSCLTCFCKNHMVQCHPSSCPSTEGCYRLQRRPRPECCQTCLGCQRGDENITHGHSWHEGCRVHQCQAGVLTSSGAQCHVPCSEALPALPGQCCPRCKSCWLEGTLVPEGATASPRLDPCVKCSCRKGKLSCWKPSCPVLSCPPSKAVIGEDGCCPVCEGSREIFVAPGGRCFLGRYLYRTGENRTHDQCTTCTCNEGFLTCERQSCPPLTCPESYRQTPDNECCPTCVHPARSQVCFNNGILREHGDTWHLDRCTICRCHDGRVTCQVDHCEYLLKECPPGFKKELSNGDCCPRCVEQPGVCVTYGDPHYKTFDEYDFNFQGDCRYQLTKDCFGRKFSIRVNNDARQSSYFSWTRSLSVKLMIQRQKYKISLGQRLRTKVNRKRVKLPFEAPGLNITRKGFLITMDTDIGVQLKWDGASYVEVAVEPSWRNRTCGLCGNFNRNATDDRRTKRGGDAETDDEMANSWLSGKATSCSRRLRRLRQKEEDEEQGQVRTQRLTCLQSRLEARKRCDLFNHTVFDQCRDLVPVHSYYQSCLQDLCECPSSRMCECDAVVAFVRACQRARVDMPKWRNALKCGGFDCPYGSLYMDCAPACRPTCENIAPNPDCHMRRCKPGCYCPPPTVLHRGSCILPDKCPKKKKRVKS